MIITEIDVAVATFVFYTSGYILLKRYVKRFWLILNLLYVCSLLISSYYPWIFFPSFVGHSLSVLFFSYSVFDEYFSSNPKSVTFKVSYQIANLVLVFSINPYLTLRPSSTEDITFPANYLILFDLTVAVEILLYLLLSLRTSRTILFYTELLFRVLFPVFLSYYSIVDEMVILSILFLTGLSWC